MLSLSAKNKYIMQAGPDQIIACPHCGALEYYETLISGNTCGAKLYSDGKQIARMLPRPPPYVECHSCHKTHWLRDATKVGALWSRDHSPDDNCPQSWAEAPLVESPSEGKLYEVIEGVAENCSAEELRQLRILAWHKRNDAYREDPEAKVDLTPLAEKNMVNLSIEWDQESASNNLSPGVILMRAELLRELGHYEAALAILENNKWGNLEESAHQLAELCRQKNSRMVEITG